MSLYLLRHLLRLNLYARLLLHINHQPVIVCHRTSLLLWVKTQFAARLDARIQTHHRAEGTPPLTAPYWAHALLTYAKHCMDICSRGNHLCLRNHVRQILLRLSASVSRILLRLIVHMRRIHPLPIRRPRHVGATPLLSTSMTPILPMI